ACLRPGRIRAGSRAEASSAPTKMWRMSAGSARLPPGPIVYTHRVPAANPLPPQTPQTTPWSRRAPERTGPPSAWALLPEEFEAAGCPGRAENVFARMQRVRTWESGRRPLLSKAIRRWLEARTDLALPEIVERYASEDGSTKLVLALADGRRIEAVHMPRQDGARWVTYCVSSQ